MTSQSFNPRLSRRTLVAGAAALGAFQMASPFIIAAKPRSGSAWSIRSPASTPRQPATR